MAGLGETEEVGMSNGLTGVLPPGNSLTGVNQTGRGRTRSI